MLELAFKITSMAQKKFPNKFVGESKRRERDSNSRYAFDVRQFSKLLVSATHPSLQRLDWEGDKGKKTFELIRAYLDLF